MAELNDHPPKQTVLVVDDTPESIASVLSLLKGIYRIKVAVTGEKALEIASSEDPPDLILLDVMMPGMDGYEVCRRLKESSKTCHVPVIFLTAKSMIEDERRGFEDGAVDYITKPISPPMIMARVKTHLELQRQRRELQERNLELRKLEEMRDNLVHMIVHDMRNLLGIVIGNLDMMETFEIVRLTDEGKKLLKRITATTRTLTAMISSILDVSRMEAKEMKLNLNECHLGDIASKVLASLEILKDNQELTLSLPDNPIKVTADPELITRVVENLLGNSIKFTPDGGKICLGIEPDEDRVRVYVQDNGPGIPPEYRDKIFEKFAQVEQRERKQKYSTGLGLTFCKLAVEAHGGRIGVDSEVGRGSTFWFELPARGPQPG